ncbi:hypothetical protein ABW21_db0202029 [Orbilia brochopaga]|nr:hypothetical protein ABW21_db0202029 [Drechslerella brochopaga]
MHFTSYVALATAALSISETVALPAFQPPAGFTLKYSGLKSLPAIGKPIQVPNNASPSNMNDCANACNSMPNCRFFTIYTPLNSDKRQCQFYEQPDPYGGNRATHFTSMVKEACGFEKQQKPAVKARDLSAQFDKREETSEQTAPAPNGTDVNKLEKLKKALADLPLSWIWK